MKDCAWSSRCSVSNTALRLARHFGMSPQFWIGLQMDYELHSEMDRVGERLVTEVVQYRKAG